VAAPLPLEFSVSHSPQYQAIRAVKAWLVHDGYREVQTYTFVKKGQIEIARGPKGKSALRANLSDGLKESGELNKRNAALFGDGTVKLFEIGTVFLGDREEIHVATIDADGTITETTIEQYIADRKIVVETTELEITPTTTPFKPWSIYPFSTRDIAVWVQSDQDKQMLETIITDFAKQYCVRAPYLFDTFTKEGKTSVAYRLVFQSYDKTLTEAEIEEWVNALVTRITERGVFEIR
jgi:phenylalanyl-tRNA synthetase beta subunit